jgi:hypothetical protein
MVSVATVYRSIYGIRYLIIKEVDATYACGLCVEEKKCVCGYFESDNLGKGSRRRPRKKQEVNIEMSPRKIECDYEKRMNWIGVVSNRGFSC